MTKKNKIKIALFTIIFLIILGFCGYIETHYTRKDCVITNIDDNIITIKDQCGHLWSYETSDKALKVGLRIDLKMYTNHTDNNIYDDEILDITLH